MDFQLEGREFPAKTPRTAARLREKDILRADAAASRCSREALHSQLRGS